MWNLEECQAVRRHSLNTPKLLRFVNLSARFSYIRIYPFLNSLPNPPSSLRTLEVFPTICPACSAENHSRIPRLFLTIALAVAALSQLVTADPLDEGFTAPPREARPRVLWMWMNGNVTADGITRDLEAMKRVGLGGALVFNIGEFIPKGPVAYGGPEWQALMLHAARECDRLGLDLAMHNSPGWSSSGGPWITPENAMRQLVWSEIFVTSTGEDSPLKLDLPQPTTHFGHYRDIRVLAFPTLPGDDVGTAAMPAELSDRDLTTTIDAGRDHPITLAFPLPRRGSRRHHPPHRRGVGGGL